MVFRQCFLRPPEVAKIVLPKVLQNFKFHLLTQGTEQKVFPRNLQYRTRAKGPPLDIFLHCATFFSFFPPKGPSSFF